MQVQHLNSRQFKQQVVPRAPNRGRVCHSDPPCNGEIIHFNFDSTQPLNRFYLTLVQNPSIVLAFDRLTNCITNSMQATQKCFCASIREMSKQSGIQIVHYLDTQFQLLSRHMNSRQIFCDSDHHSNNGPKQSAF